MCVGENIALEQWPCLSTALWGGLQREDLGCLQGLLRVHPTGDRRVTSSQDGGPPPPPAPLRNQATVGRAWFSAMLLLMDFIKGNSRGQPDGFQESFLKRVSL